MRQISCAAQGELVTRRVGNKAIPLILKTPVQDLCITLGKGAQSVGTTSDSTNTNRAPLKNEIAQLIEVVLEGLLYYPPELCEEGINGTYFLKNKSGKRIAVFKPIDEEGNTKNNPKRSDDSYDEIVNSGILAGEGAQREVAAYLLDRDHFSEVPLTTMINLSHPSFRSPDESKSHRIITKTGSLQKYIDNDGAAWDIGPSAFKVQDVHKIGVLDLRIFNNDRHEGNILMVQDKEGYRLVPIDQGLSLSSTLDHAWFDWLTWPQAKATFNEETKKYILQIDIQEDANVLKNLGIRPECIRTMKVSTMLLKRGAAMGLTLYEIGSIASRTQLEQPSALENMFEQASKEVPDGNEDKLLEVLSRIMDFEIIQKLAERCPSPRPREAWRGQIGSKRPV